MIGNAAAYRPLIESPLFALALTIACYQAGVWLYRRSRHFPLLHPTVSAAVGVAAALHGLDLDLALYTDGVALLNLLLGTATVALALPLYRQLHLIRQLARPILITTVAGSLLAAVAAGGIAWLFGAEPRTVMSLIPKSISTPFAIGVSREIGGLEALTTGVVMLTAVVGISVAPLCFRLLRITDPRVQGFSLGIAAHAMGTVRALETSAVGGAFASLGLCLAGTFSAVVLPVTLSILLSF